MSDEDEALMAKAMDDPGANARRAPPCCNVASRLATGAARLLSMFWRTAVSWDPTRGGAEGYPDRPRG